MRVVLVSEDRDLLTLLQEIVSQTAAGSLEVSMAINGERLPPGDIYIWDLQPGTKLPERLRGEGTRHILLVGREDFGFLGETAPAEASIVLKPPTPGSLAALLGGFHDAAAAVGASERDSMLEGLIRANLKLQEHDHDRTSFLARATHDLRAPVMALSGYCSLMLEQKLGMLSGPQREIMERMQHSAKRLSRMATAMFQLSVEHHVDQTPRFHRGDIRDCIDQALHEAAPYLAEKRIDITHRFKPPGEPLYFERPQIETVLINLLENACKYTPRNGSIQIGGYPAFDEGIGASGHPGVSDGGGKDGRRINCFRIDIQDSGPEIPAHELRDIFEEYTHYGGPRDRSGGGLGLAICRLIVQNHGGRVWAENCGAGVQFSFVLPMNRQEPSEVLAKSEQDTKGAAARVN